MTEDNYHGWKNRDTWLVALWLSNELGLYRGFRYILDMNRSTKEFDLRAMISANITDGTITDAINLDNVDWKEVISNQEPV